MVIELSDNLPNDATLEFSSLFPSLQYLLCQQDPCFVFALPTGFLKSDQTKLYFY